MAKKKHITECNRSCNCVGSCSSIIFNTMWVCVRSSPLHKIAGQRVPLQRDFGSVRVALITAAMDMSVDDNHSVSMMPKVTNKNGNSMTNAIEQKLVEEAANKKVQASVKETDFDSIQSYMKAMANHELLNKNEEIKTQRRKLHNNTKRNLAQKAIKSTTPTTIESNGIPIQFTFAPYACK